MESVAGMGKNFDGIYGINGMKAGKFLDRINRIGRKDDLYHDLISWEGGRQSRAWRQNQVR